MNVKKNVIGIGIVILLVGGGVVFTGWFPFMKVDGTLVYYREYNTKVHAIGRFMEKSRLVEGASVPTDDDMRELKRSTLEHMIGTIVIERYIRRNFSYDEFRDKANTIIDDALKTSDPNLLPKATKELYGMSVEKYRDEVLFPQAIQEALRRELESQGKNFANVLRSELQNTNVSLYIVPFRWEDGRVVDR